MECGNLKLLVDCGGSGVKITRYVNGRIEPKFKMVKSESLKSFDEFCDFLESVAKGANLSVCPHIDGIAISVCSEYDYVVEEVRCCRYPFLEGNLKAKLATRFQCGNVCVVNDGDAHALAFKAISSRMGVKLNGAINLSLGTAVGFGMIDRNGDLLHTCQGCNWEVGHWQCDTSEKQKELWLVLGSEGLKNLEDRCGKTPEAYIRYGQRLCHFFARDLVPIFHPKVICLSGGIVAAHLKEIGLGVQRECEVRHASEDGGPLGGIDVYLSTERESIMAGLADLLDKNQGVGLRESINALLKVNMKSICQKALCDCADWCMEIPADKSSCALLAVNARQAVCAENFGKDALVANRPACKGDWEVFTIVRNDDGSFSFKSAANDKFVSARPLPNGRLMAESTQVGAQEKFDLRKVVGGMGEFNIWSMGTQKYVSADEGKGNTLLADRDTAGKWEEFRIFCR